MVHVYGSKWRFYEVFLNEIKEATETFAEITPDEWNEFNEYAQIIESGVLDERTFRDKLKFKDKQKPNSKHYPINCILDWLRCWKIHTRLGDR